jgi:hypothetical protein
MKIVDLSTEEERRRTIFRILGFASAAVLVITGLYGLIASVVQGTDIVGRTLVEIEFPPISVFPLFYSKPVTWMVAAVVTGWFSAVELGKRQLLRIPGPLLAFMKYFAFLVAVMGFYEVLFNFTLWSALISYNSITFSLRVVNIDSIINPFPNPDSPWSIVFATKIFTVITVMCAYSFYVFHRTEQARRPVRDEGKARGGAQ